MSAPALTVLPLGGDRYRVTGGAEPHVVELGDGAGARCNCPDHHYRGRTRDCKHVAAVLRFHVHPDAVMGTAREEGA